MKNTRRADELHPGITMHKIPVKAGFAGLLFTIGTMLVCLMGIPAIVSFFLAAIMLGILVAVMLRFIPSLAGFVVLVLTSAMIVWLAVIPGVNEWREDQVIDVSWVAIPPPPPAQGELISPYPCDCRQFKSKQPCPSKPQRRREDRRRSHQQPVSRLYLNGLMEE